MKKLEGKQVGVAAARSADAISSLIINNGGSPKVFSIQGEQLLNEEISRSNISELLSRPFDYVLLTTGIGAKTLEQAAEQLGLVPDFIDKLGHTKLAIRGSKTLKWLKQHSLTTSIEAEDGTMENLLNKLSEESNGGKQVFLQAYNEDDASLKGKLEELGYTVYLSKPYQYRNPDRETLNSLQKQITNRTLDAVIFTSKTQVQNLFLEGSTAQKELMEAFNEDVLAVAVGKVTAKRLESYGVSNVFQPTDPKMGRMVVELANFYDVKRNEASRP
ncbi:uroporphyrinogen-III synthase [Virgibacillus sediminis]|uniref:Uroporphyrinogen-III synthase n=1 Tax=Virgibacillus sediminis TaxID=202260 RepID=A0ABV7A303_9BACI